MSCAGKRKARAEANQSDSTRRADSPAAAEVGRRPQAPCAGGSRGSRASRRPTQPVGPRGWAHRPCTSPGPSTASSEWCGPVTRQAESYGCNPSLGCRGGGTVAGAGRATVAEWRGPDTEPRLPRPGPLPRQRIAPPLKIVPRRPDLCHTHGPERARDAGPQLSDSPAAHGAACLLPGSPLPRSPASSRSSRERQTWLRQWHVCGSSLLSRPPTPPPTPTQLDMYVWPSPFCTQQQNHAPSRIYGRMPF